MHKIHQIDVSGDQGGLCEYCGETFLNDRFTQCHVTHMHLKEREIPVCEKYVVKLTYCIIVLSHTVALQYLSLHKCTLQRPI